jgi:ATP-dependent helicase HrpA
MPVSRAESDAFRELLLVRVLDEAFGLDAVTAMPRSKVAFEQLLAAGTPRLAPVFDTVVRVMASASAEHEKLLRAIENAAKHPSGAAVTSDIRRQLEALLPADLLAWVELRRLEHFPRYLRAAQVRLSRAIVDPRKDATKLTPLARLWGEFLAKQTTARDRAAADRLRWAFEELRVAVFAPELKPAEPVTVSSLSIALAALR